MSGFIWRKSFIQMVKCSFFSQIIVYHSFYGALLTFSYFFLQGKVLCLGMRRQVACKMLIVWSVLKTLSRIWYLRLYLTQTVHSNGKILFPRWKNCLLKFPWCAAHILLFLIFSKEKLCVSAHVSKLRAGLDCVYFVSKKKLSFSCVCLMKMGLLKRVSPVLHVYDKKKKKR